MMRVVIETSPNGRVSMQTKSNARVTLDQSIKLDGNLNMNGNLRVGGDFENHGQFKTYQDTTVIIDKNLVNTGDITIGEQDLKNVIIETIKTSKSALEFGTEFLKKIGFPKIFS